MKKTNVRFWVSIMMLLLLAVFALPVTDMSAAEEEGQAEVYYGDVDDSGKVDAKDVTSLRRYLAGGWNVTINENKADINQDGAINAKDVTMLRRYLAGGWGVVMPEPLEKVDTGAWEVQNISWETDDYSNTNIYSVSTPVLIITEKNNETGIIRDTLVFEDRKAYFFYDANGRISRQISNDGTVYDYELFENGEIEKKTKTSPDGSISIEQADSNGNTILVIEKNESDSSYNHVETTTEYDGTKKVQVTELHLYKDGSSYSYIEKYDQDENLIERITKENDTITKDEKNEYDDDGKVIKGFESEEGIYWFMFDYTYDSDGKLIEKKQNGNEFVNMLYTYTYDPDGTVRETYEYSSQWTSEPEYTYTDYRYNAKGMLVSKTVKNEYNTTIYEYSKNVLVKETIQYSETSTIVKNYENGILKKETETWKDANRTLQNIQEYDKDGHVIYEKLAYGGTHRYSYNSDGKLVAIDGIASREYDEKGRLIKLVTDESGYSENGSNKIYYTLEYVETEDEYSVIVSGNNLGDPDGELSYGKYTVYPSARTIKYCIEWYSDIPWDYEWTYRYDVDWNIVKMKKELPWHEYEKKYRECPLDNAFSVELTYKDGVAEHLKVTDKNGNISEYSAGTTSAGNIAEIGLTYYKEYAPEGKLVKEILPSERSNTEIIEYDKYGNELVTTTIYSDGTKYRVEKEDTADRTYNRLLDPDDRKDKSYTWYEADGTVAYEFIFKYDAAGRPLNGIYGSYLYGKTYEYSYDEEGNMIYKSETDISSNKKDEYWYNPDGNLSKSITTTGYNDVITTKIYTYSDDKEVRAVNIEQSDGIKISAVETWMLDPDWEDWDKYTWIMTIGDRIDPDGTTYTYDFSEDEWVEN